MKRILLIMSAILLTVNMLMAGDIVLSVVLPEAGMPEQAHQMLENKMKQAALKNGMSGEAGASQFVFFANVNKEDVEVLSTAPTKYALRLTVNFYIGDGSNGTLFSECEMRVKGVGGTEEKAYIAALKNISTSAPQFKMMIDKGKKRIEEYMQNHELVEITEYNLNWEE